MIGQIAFTLAVVVSFGLFAQKLGKLRRNILLGKPEEIKGDTGQRLKNMLLVALGQKKMFKRLLPAILHFSIYIAFIITQIELIEIFIDGFTGNHRLIWQNVEGSVFGGLYTFIISFIEILSVFALIATFIFLARRNLLKIPRFNMPEMKGWPKLDGNLILYFEIYLVTCIFMMNAGDQALQGMNEHYHHTDAFAISGLLAPMMTSWSESTLIMIERIGWWGHIVGVLVFLNYLPYSKHLHIFLAFPNTFYARITPKGELQHMPEVTKEVAPMFEEEEEVVQEPVKVVQSSIKQKNPSETVNDIFGDSSNDDGGLDDIFGDTGDSSQNDEGLGDIFGDVGNSEESSGGLDDIFGDTGDSSQNDEGLGDIFGDVGNSEESSGGLDDIFGDTGDSSQNDEGLGDIFGDVGNSEESSGGLDDIFGDTGDSSQNDEGLGDIFGDVGNSEESSGGLDDIFGDTGNSNQSNEGLDDIFGDSGSSNEAVDDIFGGNSSNEAVDDIFGNNTSNDNVDDIFGNNEQPAVAAKKEVAPPPPVEEEEEIIKFGASDIFDLSWKNLMDAYSCTECGRCTSMCPANLTGKKLSPRKVMMDVRDRTEEIGRNLDAKTHQRKNYNDGKDLFDYISHEELHACTTCNACVEACPVMINPLDIIVQLRRNLILDKADSPDSWNAMFTNIENNGAPWQFSASDRAKWIEEIN